MKKYEVQLGRIVDGAKDGEKEYNAPALMIVKADTYPSIKEIERYFFDTIKSLNCDCVYGITPLEDWELDAYKETYDKYPILTTVEDFKEDLKPLSTFVDKITIGKRCPKCGELLLKSDLPQYNYVCPLCDENFYDCEVK